MMAKGAKAMDMTGKGIVVRELVDADGVLPPEKAGAASSAVVLKCDGACVSLDGNADTAAVALVLTEGWNRAQAGLVEIIRFGATLLAVREWLDATVVSSREHGDKLDNLQQRISSSGHGGDRRSGTGIKAWLADHCPDINYKTAYGYMVAAAGLRREAKLAEDVPLLVMMGEDPVPDARAEKLRKRVQRILAESTLGLLREAATAPQEASAKGGARGGAGRPKLEASAETRAGAAWGRIGPEIDRATAWHFESFLPEAIAREALATVKLLQEALAARVQEFGKGARNVK